VVVSQGFYCHLAVVLGVVVQSPLLWGGMQVTSRVRVEVDGVTQSKCAECYFFSNLDRKYIWRDSVGIVENSSSEG